MDEVEYKLNAPVILENTSPLDPLRRVFVLTPTGRERTTTIGQTMTELSLPSGAKYVRDSNGTLHRIGKKKGKKKGKK